MIVSDHALMRYADRVLGMPVAFDVRHRGREVRRLQALGFDRGAAINTILDMAKPAECDLFRVAEEVFVYRPDVTLVVKQRTVVTILPPGGEYEVGYYARLRREGISKPRNEAMAAAFARATGVRIEGAVVRAFNPPVDGE